MNFTTDLPKCDPLCSYLVATGRVEEECYRMHVAVNSQEYSKQYRKSEILKELKIDRVKSKLLEENRNSNTERMIVCHVLLRNHCPHQPQSAADKNKASRGRKRSVPTRGRKPSQATKRGVRRQVKSQVI